MDPRLLDALAAIVGRQYVHSGPAERVAYSYDATFQQYPPEAAVSPATTEQVAAVLRLVHQEEVPVIPRGSGTGLAGGTIPTPGSLVLNLARLRNRLEIDVANSVAVVDAGVVTADLQRAAEAQGLFYPPDPASLNQSSIGGNAATNAGGPRCLKYGVTKDYVLGMTVVLADGRVLRLGGRVMKNATGYQLAQLFVGSEGTLGVITELILRLLPLPRVRRTAAAFFPSVEGAGKAVGAILQAGVLPVTIELMDQTTIGVVEDALGLGLPREAAALLLIEQDGNDATAVEADMALAIAACRELGAERVDVARTNEEREALWRARRAVSGALGRLRPNKLGEDIVVPRAAIPEMLRRIQAISAEHDLPIPVFGHAGDGNLHPNILFDKRNEGELARVEAAAADIFRSALALGGTLSGEHGIGTLKREFLEEDMGAEAVEVMRQIKAALDPKGILNPQKVFPQHGSGPAPAGFLAALPILSDATPG